MATFPNLLLNACKMIWNVIISWNSMLFCSFVFFHRWGSVQWIHQFLVLGVALMPRVHLEMLRLRMLFTCYMDLEWRPMWILGISCWLGILSLSIWDVHLVQKQRLPWVKPHLMPPSYEVALDHVTSPHFVNKFYFCTHPTLGIVINMF